MVMCFQNWVRHAMSGPQFNVGKTLLFPKLISECAKWPTLKFGNMYIFSKLVSGSLGGSLNYQTQVWKNVRFPKIVFGMPWVATPSQFWKNLGFSKIGFGARYVANTQFWKIVGFSKTGFVHLGRAPETNLEKTYMIPKLSLGHLAHSETKFGKP